MKKLLHLILVILLIAFDQVTKYFAVTNLKDQDAFQVIPGVLKFYYHENNGAVWGIMSGKIGFLVILSVIIMAGMIYFYLRIPADKKYNLMRIILVFIAAGAIGNFIDRIVNQFVVDFIYFELINFPIFNVADCYITVSTGLLIILSLFYYKDEDFDFLNKKKNTIIDNQDNMNQ
jgi:signal peptidase II